MAEISVDKLGLAAYMKMKGCQVVRVQPRAIIFDIDDQKDMQAWTLEYSQSCCRLHDFNLCDLRNMQRQASQSEG